MDPSSMTPSQIFKASLGAAITALLVFMSFFVVEYLDAKHVMTIQYPNGTIATFSEPGPALQMFGTVTKYERRVAYEFDNDSKICPTSRDTRGYAPQKIRFAEGGHGYLCGKLSWEMPTKPELLVQIQKDFASQDSVQTNLVAPALTNAVYFSGQTMTSQESSAERRGELLSYVEDQLKNGVYKTTTRQERTVDPLTKQERTITRVEILLDKDGKPQRNNKSAIGEYGISLVQTSISEIKYEKEVEDQIKQQQAAQASIKIAIANATKAEQDARTAEEKGKADAATAKWKQETIKAQAVTEAQQKLEVAELGKKEAAAIKEREILLGQGEAERKRLVMSADGALEKKLEAYVAVNEAYATAIHTYKGAWVPQYMMGGSGAAPTGGAQQMIDLLTAKTARDLGLDLGVKK